MVAAAVAGIKLECVPQPKPRRKFSGYVFPKRIWSCLVFGGIYVQLLLWKHLYFWVLTFVGVPQPKLMHGFSPNFQDMLTKTGSTAE